MKKLSMVCMLLVLATGAAMATMEDDEKDCADQLTTLAACIPYVSGTAKKPTPECCDDTKKVRAAKPKCLCVLIKESTDPSLGLPINTTLALQMPSACNIDAKVSDCPSILKIPADSPDAKIFKIDSADTSSTSTTPASSSTSSSPASSTTTTPSSSTTTDTTKTTTTGTNGGAELSINFMMTLSLAAIALFFI